MILDTRSDYRGWSQTSYSRGWDSGRGKRLWFNNHLLRLPRPSKVPRILAAMQLILILYTTAAEAPNLRRPPIYLT